MKSKLAAILAVAVLSSAAFVFAQDVVHDVDKGAKDVGHDTKVADFYDEEVEAAVKQYLATPKQSTDAMFDYLYAQLTPALRAQRELARRYAALSH